MRQDWHAAAAAVPFIWCRRLVEGSAKSFSPATIADNHRIDVIVAMQVSKATDRANPRCLAISELGIYISQLPLASKLDPCEKMIFLYIFAMLQRDSVIARNHDNGIQPFKLHPASTFCRES